MLVNFEKVVLTKYFFFDNFGKNLRYTFSNIINIQMIFNSKFVVVRARTKYINQSHVTLKL